MAIDKSYNPRQVETRWYKYWEEAGHFAPAGKAGDPYCIVIPPPNVTGSLHMGHAFQDTIMDALIRYHRMRGDNTLWQPGTDHAGIATQMVVERLINARGQTRHDYGREKFIEKVWQWKNESGGMITRQLRRMGASADWEHERFTMDPGLSRAVSEAFVQLYDEGLIYRGKRLVNWDPVLHTALSDLEVLSAEEDGSLWHLRYPLAQGDGYLVVATTRPETMLGDSAVAVHPDDEKYKALIGKWVELPLTGRRIPIIADHYVDPGFGSGCLKITPAHDFNDYQVWTRHRHTDSIHEQIHQGLINVFTVDASIRQNINDRSLSEGELIPADYIGLDRFAARDAIVADLRQQGLLDRVENHRLMIPRGDRSGAVVEPFLTDQWYVDLTREKLDDGRPGGKTRIVAPAINAVESGAIEFVPANWSKTWFQWMERIEDWCISRQIWWGHRIPVWYDDNGNTFAGVDEPAVRAKYRIADEVELRQDEDVLDTWFSSALWPFSTLGWPERAQRLKTFYPTSVLVTGFDIIFFWVARMIMFAMRFMDEAPFHQVYIHGLIRDSHGQKMSKSRGNALDPIDLIDGIGLEPLVQKRIQGLMQPHLRERIERQTRRDFPHGIPGFGADALRFTFMALASHGRDINFDLGRIEGYRNFCNKIWNAARFVLLNTQANDGDYNDSDVRLSMIDKWMISQLQRSAGEVRESIEGYRFDRVARELHDLVWNKYCAWYLELSKPILGDCGAMPVLQAGSRRTLVHALEAILRLLHPVMPFITEEIWQQISPLAGKTGETIMTQPYPEYDESRIDRDAEDEMDWVMQFILGIRKIKGEMDVPPGRKAPVLLAAASDRDLELLERNRTYLDVGGKIESIAVLEESDDEPESAVVVVGAMKILIPIDGLIDKRAETQRLNKQARQLDSELVRVREKLGNRQFVDRAPARVVAKERQKLIDLESKCRVIEQQLAKISSL